MIEAQFNSVMTTDPKIKKIVDETDPANVYIWVCKSKNSILDTDKPQWFIQKITKVWQITSIWWMPSNIYTWNSVWDDRAWYTYS